MSTKTSFEVPPGVYKGGEMLRGRETETSGGNPILERNTVVFLFSETTFYRPASPFSENRW